MGRTRTKKKPSAKVAELPTQKASENAPSIPSLLEKAQDLIVQCDYDLALRFIQRVLDREPSNAVAKEMLGVIQLETGEIESAKQASWTRSHKYHL